VAMVAAGGADVTIEPSGRYAYVVHYYPFGASAVSQYTIDTNGALIPMSTPWVAAGTGSNSIATVGIWQ